MEILEQLELKVNHIMRLVRFLLGASLRHLKTTFSLSQGHEKY